MNTEKNTENNNKIRRSNLLLTVTAIFLLMTLTFGVLVFHFLRTNFRNITESKVYDKYFVMITNNYKLDLWQSVYQGAFEEAKDQNIYLDLLGQNFYENYSCEDLMKIAIASEVDGIIVSANESEEMTELIREATAKEIPVVTLYGDNTKSDRLSFVGVGSYNIGREYGRQIFDIIKGKRREDFIESETMEERETMQITVLVNKDSQDAGQNIIISALQETLVQENATNSEFNITIVPIDNKNAFSVEESIRDIFINEDIPDVIVCLNEQNTICAYQAVVDFNKVGEVDILGYYDSESIVNAIDRKVIYATISIDTEQMGEYCIDALSDYYNYGYTNQYYTADVTLVNKSNVAKYLEGRKKESE